MARPLAFLVVCTLAWSSAAPVAAAPPKPRKVIRLDGAMDRCMGRVVRPLVVVALAARPSPEPAPLVRLRAGLALADGTSRADLDGAAAAFAMALAAAPSPGLREVALFELAKVRFRLDDAAGAAARFAELLDLPSPRLRGEALRYVAVALADTCGDGSIAKVRSFVAAHPSASWRADLWRTVGDLERDLASYPAAVEAWQAHLALAPLGPRAPEVQRAIVDAWRRDRSFERAAAEEKKLASYGPGTAWHQAHLADAAALQAAGSALAPPAPVVAVDEAVCDPSRFQRSLAGARPALAGCLAEARARTQRADLGGRVGLTLELRRDGKVAVTAQAGDLADAALVACVAAVPVSILHAPAEEPCRCDVAVLLE